MARMTPSELKAARARLGWSQRKMGEALGFRDPINSISRKERGRSPISRIQELAISAVIASADSHNPRS